jgi:O-antigen/teichoic acid export membrane protein
VFRAENRVDGNAPSGWFGWLRRGTAAIADQGLFAVANFVLNILLARWLSPRDYGGFSVAFASFLLLGTMHTALLTEPMLVFGSGRRSNDFASYIRSLVHLHWRASLVAGGALVLGGALAATHGDSSLAACLGAFAVAGPVILLTWLARRACYVRMRPEQAAVGGGVYLVSMLALLVGMRRFGLVSPASAVFAMGGAAIASLFVLLPALGIRFRGVAGQRAEASVVRDHWGYGRWALATAALGWIPSNLFLFVLPLRGGLEAAGAFRALLNLFVPMMQATSALGILALPALVKRWKAQPDRFAELVGMLVAMFGIAAAVYGVAVAAFGETLMDWMYNGRYVEFSSSVIVLAAVPALAGVAAVFGSALRAVERPELVFKAYLVPTVAAGTVGVLLAYRQQVAGASVGWVLMYAAASISLVVVFLTWWSRETQVERSRR